MRKIFLTLFIIVAFLATGVYFYLNTIIEHAIETQGSRITGSEVTLDASRVSLLSGEGSLKGLTINNPEGFRTKYAFSLDEVSVKLEPKTLLEETIVIDHIHINLPDVSYEIVAGKNNITSLRKNIARNTATGKRSTDEPAHSSKKLLVRELTMKGGKVTITVDAFARQTTEEVVLPDVVLHDIGSNSGGVSPAQLSGIIADAVLKNLGKLDITIFKQRLENLKDGTGGLFKKLF